ncbi:2-hydroxyacid dehydrogenase [Litoreibacter albidus]|uniref:Hydroxypyruvate reductase n=1 Tax=Litoreibacter albidus TaxID=670155 RepID=A0A1H2ZCJ4_9RHOB|nr:D-glycerate dehydrogenase [Litoreibacter albidus]SDX14708.1 hydroxypyruvate reductase [Litoreibacter albidus]
MKLLISRTLPPAVKEKARATFDVTLRDKDAPMSEAEVTEALDSYDMILPTLGDQFTASAISAAKPRAKLLANFGVGFNHIDVDAARAKGIAVTNTPGAVTDATADIALTLMLMTARRAGEGERLVRAGNWSGWHPTQMLGLHLTGKTVGIIGMGRIGQAIAQRCHHGFGCKIVFANRSKKDVAGATQLDSLAQVAEVADVLVAATPGGAETRHLIGADVFSAMQPHAIFINISRGDVVDEAALIAALQDGQIGGAGLDVYEQEPTVPNALTDMENVVLLPHLGTNTLEVRTSMGMMALDNLAAFVAGKDLPNPV